MTKVKIFRFEVSNGSSNPLKDDESSSWYINGQAKLVSEQEIEETINNFIYDIEVIDIKVNNIDINYHNNARGNTIHLIYTIIYKDGTK